MPFLVLRSASLPEEGARNAARGELTTRIHPPKADADLPGGVDLAIAHLKDDCVALVEPLALAIRRGTEDRDDVLFVPEPFSRASALPPESAIDKNFVAGVACAPFHAR
jgi:hypothetical protein